MRIFTIFTAIIIGLFLSFGNLSAEHRGIVYGVVVDSETGDALLGATIKINDLKVGTFSKLGGKFTLRNIPEGQYRITVTYVGYTHFIIDDVVVKSDEKTYLGIKMFPAGAMTDAIEVTATSFDDNEAALLKKRQKSASISDAISNEMMSKTSSGNVAEGMEKVTGVTVVDGKNIFIRGLGDRYIKVTINGTVLPSSDPDKNGVETDIYSSKFIDNIVAYKSYTPDKPGDFVGGMIDINTKSYTETESIVFTLKGGYNTQSSFNHNFLNYGGGQTDWLGIDDGARALPDIVRQIDNIPTLAEARYDPEKALLLDKISNSFQSEMSPKQDFSGLDQNWSISYGNSYEIGKQTIGFIAGFNYSNDYKVYSQGKAGQYKLSGKVAEVNELNPLYQLTDSKGEMNVRWNAMFSFGYVPDENNRISFNYSNNNSGEKVSRYLNGYAQTLGDDDAIYETRALTFSQRNVNSFQLNGHHNIINFNDMKIDWSLSTNFAQRVDPNLRYFVDDYTPFEVNNDTINIYSISASNYTEPAHYYRNLDEEIYESGVDIELPINLFRDLSTKVKFGNSYIYKNRNFSERIFKYRRESDVEYKGNSQEFFSDSLIGIVDYNSNTGRYYFGNYITDQTQPANSYKGNQDINAFYGMLDFQVTKKLRLITGARLEMNNMLVQSKDSTKNYKIVNGENVELGRLINNDILPALSIIYTVDDGMNLRFSYGKTLARPTFREIAPFPSFDYVGGYILNGNQELKRTIIQNFDLRWEWFRNQEELLAFSLFYKDFQNPIEMAILSTNNQVQYQNVKEAVSYGFETEYRIKLNHLFDNLQDFSFGGNFSYIFSKVSIPTKELIVIKELNPDASATRPLNGQSPYVINLMLSYDNHESDLHFNLYYNVFGKRLSKVSLGGTPNVYEYPRDVVDFNAKYRVFDRFKVGLSVQNILNSSYTEAISYKDVDYYVSKYKLGRTISVTFSYEY